jgi:hypothetical protein
MKPIKFEEATKNLSKPSSMTDDECGALWVHNDGKVSISCWKMSWKERIKALIHGKMWLGVMAGESQPPVWVDPVKPEFSKQDGK